MEMPSVAAPSTMNPAVVSLDVTVWVDATPVDISGGVMVYRSDFRVLYDNSLEAIFQRKRGQIRCTLAKILF